MSMILIAGAARVGGPASYDYSPVEEGLRHAGLVAVDLLRACLSSDVPAVVLGGHSFGIGALGFHDFQKQMGRSGSHQNETDGFGADSGVARNVASCLESMGAEIRALVAHDLAHRSRTPSEPLEHLRHFATRPCGFSGCDWMRKFLAESKSDVFSKLAVFPMTSPACHTSWRSLKHASRIPKVTHALTRMVFQAPTSAVPAAYWTLSLQESLQLVRNGTSSPSSRQRRRRRGQMWRNFLQCSRMTRTITV